MAKRKRLTISFLVKFVDCNLSQIRILRILYELNTEWFGYNES